MKATRILRFLLLLAAAMFASHVYAQIKVISFNSVTGKKTTLKIYTPRPLQISREDLIKELNNDIRNITGYTNCRTVEGLKALDDRLKTVDGTLLYYTDIATETMNLYVDKRGNAQVGIKGVVFAFDKNENAQTFAEHLYATVPHSYQELNLDSLLVVFKPVAEQYHALQVKPEITEEQRKYIVQANLFNQKKEYDKAISLYNKVIEIEQTAYPAAYYNQALLLAQTQRFREAIYNMKKYLMLVPEAEDARAAQDKIYEWEAELTN